MTVCSWDNRKFLSTLISSKIQQIEDIGSLPSIQIPEEILEDEKKMLSVVVVSCKISKQCQACITDIETLNPDLCTSNIPEAFKCDVIGTVDNSIIWHQKISIYTIMTRLKIPYCNIKLLIVKVAENTVTSLQLKTGVLLILELKALGERQSLKSLIKRFRSHALGVRECHWLHGRVERSMMSEKWWKDAQCFNVKTARDVVFFLWRCLSDMCHSWY